MKNLLNSFVSSVALLFVVLLATSTTVSASKFDVRFNVNNFDCASNILLVDIEIKAAKSASMFYVRSQNYRFNFNADALINPSIKEELTISGVKSGSGYTAFFQPHHTNGTGGNVVSYNVPFGSGMGYPIDQDWVSVGRLQFEVLDNTLPFNFSWHGANDFPATVVQTISGQVAAANLNNYSTFTKSMDITVLLEGPYNSDKGQMNNFLNLSPNSPLHRGLLPGQAPYSHSVTPTPAGQPYNVEPWNYQGSEGDNMHDYDETAVDWVLVSFLDGAMGNPTKVWEGAAILHNNGKIEFINMPNYNLLPASFYIRITHRNHMSVMSPSPVDNGDCDIITYDFTTQNSYAGTAQFGQKEVEPGVWAMYAGDVAKGNEPYPDINGADHIIWEEENGYFDKFSSPDFNLNGDVNAVDKAIWSYNNGISSGVPK